MEMIPLLDHTSKNDGSFLSLSAPPPSFNPIISNSHVTFPPSISSSILYQLASISLDHKLNSIFLVNSDKSNNNNNANKPSILTPKIQADSSQNPSPLLSNIKNRQPTPIETSSNSSNSVLVNSTPNTNNNQTTKLSQTLAPKSGKKPSKTNKNTNSPLPAPKSRKKYSKQTSVIYNYNFFNIPNHLLFLTAK